MSNVVFMIVFMLLVIERACHAVPVTILLK